MSAFSYLRLGMIIGWALLTASSAYAALHQQEFEGGKNTGALQVIVCGTPRESSGGQGGSDPGDASTENRQQYGPCSAVPRPHHTTPRITADKLNPMAFAFLESPQNNGSGAQSGGGQSGSGQGRRPYQDAAYGRGTPGDVLNSKRMVGDDEPVNDNRDLSAEYDQPGAKPRLNAARPMIRPKQEPQTLAEKACLNRVKWDNAVNQTIMYAAKYPFNREGQRSIGWEDESQPGKKLSMKNHCQGLRTTMDPQEEYRAGDYIYAAYQKTMRDPKYRMTGSEADMAFMSLDNQSIAGSIFGQANAALTNTLGKFPEPGIIGLDSYNNPAPDDQAYKNIRINPLGAVPIEWMADSTHLFTPRWHYKGNERDELSPKGKDYAEYEKDNVRCAGDAGENKVKVDILEFRRKDFVPPMTERIEQNKACWKDQIRACCDPVRGKCLPVPCWKCFGLDGKTDTPPCSTRYNQEDLTVLESYRSLVPNRKLQCGTTAASLCEKLRAPYRMVNVLKIRRQQKDHPLDRLPNGSPEGYTHAEYFGNRMPYPIQWDTGRPIQDTPSTTQLPNDFAGQYAAVVGVGREKRAPGGGNSSGSQTTFNETNEDIFASLFGASPAYAAGNTGGGAPTNANKDERCMRGGWGKDTQCSGMRFRNPDPMTSITELKAYQARTISDFHLNCIGQYHKLFAPGDAVGKALTRAGGVYEREICTKRNSNGNWQECGSNAGGSGNGGGSEGKESWEKDHEIWPIADRGPAPTCKQIKEDEQKPCKQRQFFPNQGAEDDKCPKLLTGLDEAKPGDIIIMCAGGAKEQDSDATTTGASSAGDSDGLNKPLPPTVAFIKSAHNNASTQQYKPCSGDKNCHLIVDITNDGQFPDVCGNTTSWGGAQSRTIYKPGNMPESVKNKQKEVLQGQSPAINPE